MQGTQPNGSTRLASPRMTHPRRRGAIRSGILHQRNYHSLFFIVRHFLPCCFVDACYLKKCKEDVVEKTLAKENAVVGRNGSWPIVGHYTCFLEAITASDDAAWHNTGKGIRILDNARSAGICEWCGEKTRPYLWER